MKRTIGNKEKGRKKERERTNRMKDRQKKKKEGTNGVEEKERSYKQTNMRDKERAN